LFYEWPQADAIIGNPPFLGRSRMRLELGDEYTEKVFKHFKEIHSDIDFSSYWFRLAHDHLGENGRAGLVATNSISQGRSREASLDYITKNSGYIFEAISSQVWSGEAKVFVSLVNWSKNIPDFYILDHQEVLSINSSLKSSISVVEATILKGNQGISFIGCQATGKGFLVLEEKAKSWLSKDQNNSKILKPYSTGENLTKSPHGKPNRWIIDFNDLTVEEAGSFKDLFEHVYIYVKPERDQNRDSRARAYWWKFVRHRPEMRLAIQGLSYYFAVSRVSKWFIFIPVSTNYLPADSTAIVISEDFYILGILTSQVHRNWVKVQSSTLKGDTRYTPSTCFETFPFPQTPSAKIVQKIRQTAIDLHEYRSQMMEQNQYGITKLYNQFFDEPTSQLYKLHKQLDKLTLQAYGFSETDDILEQLLNLNQKLANQEKAGNAIVGPWDPTQKSDKEHS